MSCRCHKEIETVINVEGTKAIGPYSPAVKFSHFVFTSGQIGIDPTTGDIITGGIENETHQVFSNLKAVLSAANSSLENVLKTTVFLKDMADFQKMNAIYAGYFKENPPARSTIQVAALPKGALIEIECIAALEKSNCKED